MLEYLCNHEFLYSADLFIEIAELFPLFTTPSVIVHRPQQSQEQETVFAVAQNASKPFAKMFAKFATSNVSMPVDSQLLRRFEASLGQIPGLKYPSINTFNKPLEEIVPPTNLKSKYYLRLRNREKI
uniref:Uncharacterized protein n=1 Tax=Parascaris equorum TaxID=6256 RepID=A0A914RIM5_PAREQ